MFEVELDNAYQAHEKQANDAWNAQEKSNSNGECV